MTGGYADAPGVESSLPTDGMLGMDVPGIVEVTNIKCSQEGIKSWYSPCDKVDLYTTVKLHRYSITTPSLHPPGDESVRGMASRVT